MVHLRTWLVWGLLLLSLGFALWALHVGWHYPLLDAHSFRQTQTALSVLGMKKGGPLLAYETPVLGAPWRLPLEFPFYQWMVLLVDHLPGLEMEQAGRLVSAFFLLVSVATILFLLKEMEYTTLESLSVLPIFLLSPTYLFWGRTFLIETTALSLSLLYLLCGLRLGRLLFCGAKMSMGLLLTTLFFGVLAAVVKITTFLFFPGILILLLFFADLPRGGKLANMPGQRRRDGLLRYLSIFILPFVANSLWMNYANGVRAEIPFADFLQTRALTTWTFGTNEQRFSLAKWKFLIGERFVPDLLGHLGTLACFLSLVLLPRKEVLRVLSWLACFLLYPLVFINLYLAHSYYQIANGFFLLLAVATLLIALSRSGRGYFSLLLTLLLLVVQVNKYLQEFYPFANSTDSSILEVAARVRQFTKPDEVVLIYGLDWSPEVPYYSERRAVMDRDFRSLDDPLFVKSKQLSVGQQGFGGVLACGKVLGNLPEVEQRVVQLGLSEKDFFQVRTCRIYMRAQMKDAPLY